MISQSKKEFNYLKLPDMYSQAFTEEVTRIKIMVYSVHAALTVQIIMLMNNLWRVYAAGFGDLGAFDLVSTTWFSVIVIESIGGSHGFPLAQVFWNLPHIHFS